MKAKAYYISHGKVNDSIHRDAPDDQHHRLRHQLGRGSVAHILRNRNGRVQGRVRHDHVVHVPERHIDDVVLRRVGGPQRQQVQGSVRGVVRAGDGGITRLLPRGDLSAGEIRHARHAGGEARYRDGIVRSDPGVHVGRHGDSAGKSAERPDAAVHDENGRYDYGTRAECARCQGRCQIGDRIEDHTHHPEQLAGVDPIRRGGITVRCDVRVLGGPSPESQRLVVVIDGE